MRAQLIELTAGEFQLVAEGEMIEETLHQRLAIVECPFERNDVHIVGSDTGHLAALHVGDAAVRVENEDIDLFEAAEGRDRRGSGIARGRADDRRALAARLQHMVHQPGEQLHRHVLEGERRPMEELEDEEIVVDLDERSHGRMAEGRIGLRDHIGECTLGDRGIEERRDDARRNLGIGTPGKARDVVSGELRVGRRDVETAVAGKPCQHGLGKGKHRRFAAGGNIVHVEILWSRDLGRGSGTPPPCVQASITYAAPS